MGEMTYENYDYMGNDYNRNNSYDVLNDLNFKIDTLEIILISVLLISMLALVGVMGYTVYYYYINDSLFSRYKRKLKMEKHGEITNIISGDEKISEENKKKVIEMNIYINDDNSDGTTESDRINDNGGGESKNSK
jgi:hypothetical protein